MWILWKYFVWNGGIPVLFLFLSGYFYSRAILLGIACAGDEQHRMTP